MPTFNHGKNAVVLLDNTNLSTTLTDASVSLTADVAETSTFTASSKTYVSGLKDGTATLSGYFESSSPDADAEFLAQLGSSGSAFSIAPIGYTRGNPTQFGNVIETSYDRSADIGSVVAVAVAFQFDGDAYNGKSLLTPTAITSSSNQTGVDYGAAGTNGGAGVLHCTVKSGSPTLDVKIQTSADNVSYSDYITFTQATGTTSELKTSASNPARYARAVLTFGGSGSITAAVSFAQK
tara:strand:+ start:1600 stop:2310 length:711 start_codon:yes stop_codon:yes gene_type:complete